MHISLIGLFFFVVIKLSLFMYSLLLKRCCCSFQALICRFICSYTKDLARMKQNFEI